jgi:hypothetical protein
VSARVCVVNGKICLCPPSGGVGPPGGVVVTINQNPIVIGGCGCGEVKQFYNLVFSGWEGIFAQFNGAYSMQWQSDCAWTSNINWVSSRPELGSQNFLYISWGLPYGSAYICGESSRYPYTGYIAATQILEVSFDDGTWWKMLYTGANVSYLCYGDLGVGEQFVVTCDEDVSGEFFGDINFPSGYEDNVEGAYTDAVSGMDVQFSWSEA